MHLLNRMWLKPAFILIAAFALTACGGGGGGGSDAPVEPNPPVEPPAPPPPAPPEPEVLTENQAARFLSQSTFGPSQSAVDGLIDSGAEAWLLNEFDKPATLLLPRVLAGFGADGEFRDDRGMPLPGVVFLGSDAFWQVAIEGDDQLRQRMAFALSQILVISVNSALVQYPQTVAHYADILAEGAFGNYRDLLTAITYSPAMSIYLTYLRNEKADPATGRVPDENYAREILQLFTLGLIELNPDGSPLLNEDGSQRELYDNDDVTELAKVFTGLSVPGIGFNAPLRFTPLTAFYSPLEMFDAFHSAEPKQFLGTTIPANTGGEETIELALDAIFAHPNVGPFVGRQLIQRFVTSAPSPAYVQRVAGAFDSGSYTLPSGTQVGTGARGDLKAVIAAVLFDEQARDDAMTLQDERFGKLREPILRFTHWARAFEINSADASNELLLKDTARPDLLGQQAYRSPSVFNFYRPGYIAPGTETGDAGLTAPELQITTASSIVGYPNFMTAYALGLSSQAGPGRNEPQAYQPDYSTQLELANDADALLDNLDTLLTHGALKSESRSRIIEVLDLIPADDEEGRLLRAQLGIILVMTTPEYIVQR
ncbi:MAG: DUF1800 family protein [Halioglobus sp.]